MVTHCDKSQEGRLIGKYQSAIQTNTQFEISGAELTDAGAAMGMGFAKVLLDITNRQTNSLAFIL